MKTYKDHYKECRDIYNSANGVNLYNVAIEKNCIKFDDTLLDSLAEKIKAHLERNHDTTDSKWCRYVNDFSTLPELNVICSDVVNLLEEKYFGSYVKIEFLHVLENKTNVPLESSWVWHYDDCPKEFLKFAIYLNDVTENNGPTQFVRAANNAIPVIETYRDHPGAIKGVPPPVFPKSRVPPQVVDQIVSKGGKIESIVGKKGTNFLFTPNIIHRGTAPKPNSTPRMAIFMFVRPSKVKINNVVKAANPKKLNLNVKKYILD